LDTYYDYEQLTVLHPAWNLSEIRRLTVRERKHWIKFFTALEKQHGNIDT